MLSRVLDVKVHDLIFPESSDRESSHSVGLISGMCGVMWNYEVARTKFFSLEKKWVSIAHSSYHMMS